MTSEPFRPKAAGANDEFLPDKDGWTKVGPGTPLNALLETRMDGEEGTSLCHAHILSIGEDVEWIDNATGITTVTHHSYAAPTHWR